MPVSRPFNDGLSEGQRAAKRKQAWSKPTDPIKRQFWTSKLCSECRVWNDRETPEKWCEHFKNRYSSGGSVVDAPAVDVFKPYFNPNIQHGGAWLETRQQEKHCANLNGKEWKH